MDTTTMPQKAGLEDLPAHSGSYVLILYLPEAAFMPVGRLGERGFAAGFYLYVGSARGSGGLRSRLQRHLRQNKTAHWHIDHLRRRAEAVEAWFVESSEPLECRWGAILRAQPGLVIPVPGFGSSDCRCPAHLFYSAEPPGSAVRQSLEGVSGRPLSVTCWVH